MGEVKTNLWQRGRRREGQHYSRMSPAMEAILPMSDGSCSDPFRFHDDQYLDNYSPLESTGFELSANTPTMENIKNPKDIVITTDDVEVVAAVSGGAEQVDVANNEEQAPFTKRKRKKTSGVWEHFHLVKLSDGTEVFECIHCGEKIKKLKDGTTTLLHRHIGDCPKLKAVNRGSKYPTSNLFLSELFGIKEALDTVVLDVSDYMMAMAMKMKRKFDKYKMKLLEFSFNSIYSPDEAPRQMKIVRDTLYELYQEYIEAHKATHIVSSTEAGGS
ncbi:hypothetical protein V6N13_106609 [Hibiscus sabdariffa]